MAVLTSTGQLYIPNHDYYTKDYFDYLDVSGVISQHGGLGNFIYQENSYVNSRIYTSYQWNGQDNAYSTYYRNNNECNDSKGESCDSLKENFNAKLFGYKTSYIYSNDETRVMISPVIHAGFNQDQFGNGFMNSRGMEIKGTVDGKVSFYTLVTDNQMNLPRYIDQKIAESNYTMPGEVWLKAFKAGETNIIDLDDIGTVDFFQTRAYINFKATKSIDIQFGQDKNKLGHGFRSLVLSDYATPYPFLKFETTIGKVKFQNLFMELNNWPNRTSNALIQKKHFASHTVSWNLNDNLNLSIFENIMYARADTAGMAHLEWQYLNPVIFYRSAEHGLGSPDNASLGLMGKYDLYKTAKIYGQFYLDDVNFQSLKGDFTGLARNVLLGSDEDRPNASWSNKWATQIGVKYYDAFKFTGLDMQLERNWVKPYTYSHRDTRQAYMHNAQALAHPLGANFKELLFIASLTRGRWRSEIKLINIVGGMDTGISNWGSDITKTYWNPGPDYTIISPDPAHYVNSIIGRGANYSLNSFAFYLGYEIKHNLTLEIEVKKRTLSSEIESLNQNDRIFSLGLRWNIGRKYYDF